MRLEGQCEIVHWFELVGAEREPELREIQIRGIVGQDNVHLSQKVCRDAAVKLCYRVAEEQVVMVEEGRPAKRMRN